MEVHSHEFAELIWTARVDSGKPGHGAAAGTIGVQVRDAGLKQAWFCLVDMGSGLAGPMIALENGWWTELLGVKGHVLHVGRYGDASLPVITEVVMVDGRSGEVLGVRDGQADVEAGGDVLVPATYEGTLVGHALEPEVLPGSVVVGLQVGDFRMRAWHGMGGSGIELWLEIWEGDVLVLRTCLETGMEKLNPAPFFVAGGWVVFIRGRRELCWVGL
jgi:hypothetical protein